MNTRKLKLFSFALSFGLLFSSFGAFANDDVVEAYFKTPEGETVSLDDVTLSTVAKPITTYSTLANSATSNEIEWEKETEVTLDAKTLAKIEKARGITSDGSISDDRYDNSRNIKLWVKLFYSKNYNNVLITRIQSVYRNNAPNRFSVQGFFVGVSCRGNWDNSQWDNWEDLPGQSFDRYTGYRKYVSVTEHDHFYCFGRSQVAVYNKSGTFLGYVYLNLQPWGGQS